MRAYIALKLQAGLVKGPREAPVKYFHSYLSDFLTITHGAIKSWIYACFLWVKMSGYHFKWLLKVIVECCINFDFLSILYLVVYAIYFQENFCMF